MKNRNNISISLLIAGILIVSACFAPLGYKSGDTTLSVGFGGSLPRAAIAPEDLYYEITFSGPGGRTITETANWGETTTVQVVPGNWSISVEAFDPTDPGVTQAIGEAYNIDVRAGQQNNAAIKMAVYREVTDWAGLSGVITDNPFYDVFIVVKNDFTANVTDPISIIGRTVTITADIGRTITRSGSFSFFGIGDNGHLILGSAKYSGSLTLNGTSGMSMVQISTVGRFTMNSGTLADNDATTNGGAVNNLGTFTMNGGTISGNTTTGNGSGVYNNGTFTMSGNALVHENNDVYLQAGRTINITGNLTGSGGATIRPESYTAGTDVLSGSSGLVAANRSRFSVVEDSTRPLFKWMVNTVGKIHIHPFIEMVPIPADNFTMGSEDPLDIEASPSHPVTLSAFYMGIYQVTQEQYQTIMGSNPSNFDTGADAPNRPVETVSWYDTLVFANRLSMLEGLSPAYQINNSTNPDDWGTVPTISPNTTWDAAEIVTGSTGYRLPTEAQWEYACKAGTDGAYNPTWDGTPATAPGWYWENSGTGYASGRGTHEVGLRPQNDWGLYDMHGNISEWCWDWYGAYTSSAQTNPAGPASGTVRVTRGGSWSDVGQGLRSAVRGRYIPRSRDSLVGFRLIRP